MQKTTRPAARDPFAVLGIPHTATAADARRAFRRLAFDTHPDRGGEPAAFRAAREAADALATAPDVARERARWAPPPPASGVRYGPRPEVRYRAHDPVPFDATRYPPCPSGMGGEAGGLTFSIDPHAVPDGWTPPEAPPPGGVCLVNVTNENPSVAGGLPFGVWIVLGVGTVFGPSPRG